MASRQKSVFLTGATGFLGQAVAKRLVAEGYKVTALTHSKNPVPEGCTPAYATITDAEAISEFVSRNDYVIHLAGIVGNVACNADIANAIQVNVAGTLNVLAGMAYFKVPGIYVGVGNADDISIYAITKTTGERFTHMYNKEHGTKALPIRIFNVYGPGQSPESGKLIPKTIAAAQKNQDIEMFGDGTLTMDFIHVDDAAYILAKSLEGLTKESVMPTEALHIGTGKGVSVREAVEAIKTKLNSRSQIKTMGSRPGDITKMVVAETEKMVRIPGFQPRDLQAGLTSLMN